MRGRVGPDGDRPRITVFFFGLDSMQNLKMTIRYDGTEFYGWQTQPGFRTVQDTFEKAVESVTRARVRANASGRTDSGVHAYGQVANFFSGTRLDGPTLIKAVNANLPEDVSVTSCEPVGQAFCANRDARRKMYRYVINDGRIPDPFLRKHSWQPRRILDVDAMHSAAQFIVGRHDFSSFETEGSPRLSSIRILSFCNVTRQGETVQIEVEANGFLYNMVRSITGTLYNIGRGYWPVSHMKTILEGQDRTKAGPTAPPQGLFLMRVTY